MAAALTAAVAVATLPQGSGWRLALTLPVLFFASGYLLIQALVVPNRAIGGRFRPRVSCGRGEPGGCGRSGPRHSAASGGFRAGTIVTLVTVACLLPLPIRTT